MRSIIRFYTSVALVVAVTQVGLSQQKASTKKSKFSYAPTGLRVGTDILDLVKTGTGNSFKGWEINGDIDLSKYYLTADIGSWRKNVQLPNGEYANSGSYFRIGADLNLLSNDPDKNMFFFGFRIGHSLFHEALTYQATSVNLYPPSTYAVSNSSVTGSWGEFTTGLRVRVWKGFWMGYTARMKFSPTTKGSSASMVPYDMPGYGIVSQKLWWGFNYQMFWRFAWKKDKPAPKKN